ncbi:histidine phosphatase family protein [Lacticaseibacillus nasuensis]|uniref:histidine phosphatase family protein n=1 Tax=Lacticaseibacillus nasuensis TaxID=944671 RepID=UPI002246E73D|nr:histidine phosphatase family protein [Lacticaseibacillus nasuensis]MCX2456111.1 histidine phosphatase family protein [Lacticaseibacillus nasuensis]
MTKLYFVRHGKTEWNLQGRYQGANGDSPLLPESYEQIHQLAAYLHPVQFAHCYVSPLPRAQTTAKVLLADLGQTMPVTTTVGMREFNLGKMEGMRFAEVAKRYPRELHAFRSAPADYDPTAIAGESFPELIARMQPVVTQAVAADHTGQANLLFVSHGAALVALIQSLLGTPIADMRKDGGLTNSSVTILAADSPQPPYRLIKWNDTEFLTKRPDPTDTI